MAKINKSKVLSLLKNPRSIKRIRGEAIKQARLRFYPAKDGLLQDVENDDVSKEIQGGNRSENITGSLSGKGNLFSFIGFTDGSQPVKDLLKLINSKLRAPTVKRIKRKDVIGFTANFSTIDSKYIEQSPITSISNYGAPYTTRSWIGAIRYGLAGYSNYLYQTIKKGYKGSPKRFEGSRSGTAVQWDSNLRSGHMQRMSYLGPHLAEFRRKLKAKK